MVQAYADCPEVMFAAGRVTGNLRYFALAMAFLPEVALHAAASVSDETANQAAAVLLDEGVVSESGDLRVAPNPQTRGLSAQIDALVHRVHVEYDATSGLPKPPEMPSTSGSTGVARLGDERARLFLLSRYAATALESIGALVAEQREALQRHQDTRNREVDAAAEQRRRLERGRGGGHGAAVITGIACAAIFMLAVLGPITDALFGGASTSEDSGFVFGLLLIPTIVIGWIATCVVGGPVAWLVNSQRDRRVGRQVALDESVARRTANDAGIEQTTMEEKIAFLESAAERWHAMIMPSVEVLLSPRALPPVAPTS